MITLKNWYKQQPEVVYFVQTDYQGDEFMKKFVRSKMPKEQWDKIVAKGDIFGLLYFGLCSLIAFLLVRG